MTTSSFLPRIGVTRSRNDPRDPFIFGNYGACVERAGRPSVASGERQ